MHENGHRTFVERLYCMLWIRIFDASRKLLSGVESKTAMTNKHSISTVKEAIEASWEYNVVVRQANTDRGSEFYSNEKRMNPGF